MHDFIFINRPPLGLFLKAYLDHFFLSGSIVSFSLQLQEAMPQVIVLNVHMRCEKCRAKALKIAAEAYGVTAMRLEGEDLQKLRVEGQHVNIAKLVQTLKKKVGYTQIFFVSDI